MKFKIEILLEGDSFTEKELKDGNLIGFLEDALRKEEEILDSSFVQVPDNCDTLPTHII